jgi:hypothetical protein
MKKGTTRHLQQRDSGLHGNKCRDTPPQKV